MDVFRNEVGRESTNVSEWEDQPIRLVKPGNETCPSQDYIVKDAVTVDLSVVQYG